MTPWQFTEPANETLEEDECPEKAMVFFPDHFPSRADRWSEPESAETDALSLVSAGN